MKSPLNSDRRDKRFRHRTRIGAVVFGLVFGLNVSEGGEGQIEFIRAVLPILKRACFDCHGPEKQQGDLRLDSKVAAFCQSRGPTLIVPGQPDQSELVRRIELPEGHAELMPARGGRLSEKQIATLRLWIAEGASWPDLIRQEPHWAYQSPLRRPIPAPQNASWPRNDLDRFILERMEKESLQPSPEADRATLIRRVHLDLIGLPPSLERVESFLKDDRSDAYERVVEQLFESPHFGEKWARPWLDLARYADSHGFQRDDLRDLWPYRDWVIRAINGDMPFDQFTVEQIAGDLLPDSTFEQRIATGFHRCTTMNVEAGSEPEETRVNQVFDRVNTTATVWLGTTLECAQCHDHKYDPFTQLDYYRLFAFFNNTIMEAERSDPSVPGSIKFLGPNQTLADPVVDAEKSRLNGEIDRLKQEIAERRKQLIDDVGDWELIAAQAAVECVQTHSLEITDFTSEAGSPHKVLDDRSILLVDEPPDRDTYTVVVRTALTGIQGFKLEALTDASLPESGPGRGENFALNQFTVAMIDELETGKTKSIALQNAKSSSSQKEYPASQAIDNDPATAWIISAKNHEAQWATFETAQPVGNAAGVSLGFTLVQQSGGGKTIGRLRLSALTGQLGGRQLPAEVAQVLNVPRETRTEKQIERLIEFRLELDPVAENLKKQMNQLDQQFKALKSPTTLVMSEMNAHRTSHVFDRGNYLTPAAAIEPGTPKILHPFPDGPQNRLTLARWLVARENPLTARVTVNRWWSELFGRGIVGTVEDFGVKGDPPTHPELLDWLALEFMERGWSLKTWLRTVVTSATYRQSSRATPAELQRDPENQFYTRSSRVRMDAEMIRDNILSVAGLLSLKSGGPPVRPYQPDGLWTKIGGDRIEYVVSPGADKYRRGIYVIWKRSNPYPSFINFDAPARLTCVPRRTLSNTPLQALTLLNDPVYVEAALSFARRILRECPSTTNEPNARISYGFRLCSGRSPSDSESAILMNLFANQLEAGREQASVGRKLIGSDDLPESVTSEEFAAWYSVASALLNLDDSITRE